MSVGTPPITNFTGGEWSPRLYGRVDIDRWRQACSELVNMTLMPHGPVTRRMGTEFIIEAAAPGARLIEFIYNTEQAYVLEITPGLVRFFRDGGYLEGKDISTPYAAEDIKGLSFCQAADKMYLVCPDVAPQVLTRPGVDAFQIATVEFEDAPEEWSAGNWPGCATFFQQRLWLAGCPSRPQTIWASKTGDFEDFGKSDPIADDDALSLSLVSEQVNAVRWLLSQKVLVAGTSGGEWVLSAGSDAALTSKNLTARLNSNYGCSALRPLLAGAASSHVSADGRRLMSFFYEYSVDSYISQDLSLLGEHLTKAGIVSTANCQNPDGIIWCVMADGAMAGCTWLRDQEVTGWHRFETRGKVRDVCCVPGDGYTETWLVVERENGTFIERMAAPWDGETTIDPACFYVDCGLAYQGGPVTGVSGLEHLEGQEVNVLADGAQHRRLVVEDGAIDLDYPSSLVIVGLPYEWRVAPMNVEGLSPRGTMQGKKALLVSGTARLYKTLGLFYERTGGGDRREATFRESAGNMDAPPLPFTGDYLFSLPGGWHTDTRLRLSGDGAFPATVVMMILTVSVNN